jgi:hypothetical protein
MLLDGYMEDEFKSVCRELWARGDSLLEYYLYILIDILLGYYMLTYSGEGPTHYMPLIFTIRASK